MEKVRRFVVDHLWIAVLALACVMLAFHTLGLQALTVDNNSLILLAIILLSPFVAAVKKIKIGDFEAEIDPSEVAKVAEEVESSIPFSNTNDASRSQIDEALEAIKNLSVTDPVLALAKLRIELETRLRKLCIWAFPDDQTVSRSIMQMTKALVSAGILAPDFGNAFRKVTMIANRAIHGEDIRDIDAATIVTAGTDLLRSLDVLVQENTISHPINSQEVSAETREEYSNAKYKLTTIVPLVESPRINTYELSQSELDTFLDGYSEYAEFLISLEKIA